MKTCQYEWEAGLFKSGRETEREEKLRSEEGRENGSMTRPREERKAERGGETSGDPGGG